MPRFSEINAAIADTGAYLYLQHNQALPYGSLICDGATLQVATYPKLFAKIGTAFGGDGITTFNLPDLRGRSIMGAGLGTGLTTSRTLNGLIGEETVSLTVVPLHSHLLSYAGAGAHSHTYTALFEGGQQTGSDTIPKFGATTNATSVDGSHTHTLSTSTDGSGTAHNNIHPVMPSRIAMVVI